MYHVQTNEIIEILRLNIGWHYCIEYSNNQIKLQHKRYVFKLFNTYLTIPLEFLIGTVYSQEDIIDDNKFSMFMVITHPSWGELYKYSGEFIIHE